MAAASCSSAQPGNSVRVGSLDSPDTKSLLSTDSKALYAAPGYLLFVREATLMAQPFDPSRAEPTGDAVSSRRVTFVSVSLTAALPFRCQRDGVLAYRSGAAFRNNQLTWLDRSGKVLQTIVQPADYRNVALSPDDSQVSVHRHEEDARRRSMWIVDSMRGTTSRFSSNPSHNVDPQWSPDGGRIVFGSNRDGGISNLYQNVASGTGPDERLLTSTTNQVHRVGL